MTLKVTPQARSNFPLFRLAPAQIQAMELPSYDIAWAESKMKKAALKLEKLDTDLKNYKANSIKGSVTLELETTVLVVNM